MARKPISIGVAIKLTLYNSVETVEVIQALCTEESGQGLIKQVYQWFLCKGRRQILGVCNDHVSGDMTEQ